MKTKNETKTTTKPAYTLVTVRKPAPKPATPEFIYAVRTCSDPAVWVGLPHAVRTADSNRAATWLDESDAATHARIVGGDVVARPVVTEIDRVLAATAHKPRPKAKLSLVPTVAYNETRRPKKDKVAEPKAESSADMAVTGIEDRGDVLKVTVDAIPEAIEESPSKASKSTKGLNRDEVLALLKASGLTVTEKSSSHYGDIKGPRLVLPRSSGITRIFLYRMPDATTLLGYRTPDERKAQRLGQVTHVADVTTIDQVKALITAVRTANGLEDVQEVTTTSEKPKAKRTRKPKAGSSGESQTQTEGTSSKSEES